MKKIENINSKVSFKIGIDKNELIPHQYCLYLKAKELPLYLVEPDMMDLLYPPTKKIILDERKVYNQFKEIKSSSNRYNINEIKDLNKLTREAKITETMICVGLYMPSKPEFSTHKTSFTYDRASINQIEQYNDYSNLLDKLEYPAIFICPERIFEWADKLGINSQVLFKKVYFHELGHSYIHNSNRNSYNNIYYKIIEESFCNAIALNEFLNPDELKQAVSAIYSQPLEYKCGVVLFKNSKMNVFFQIVINKYDEIKWIIRDYIRSVNSERVWDRYLNLLKKFADEYGYRFLPLFPFKPFPEQNFVLNLSFIKYLWNNNDIKEEIFKEVANYLLEALFN